MKQKSQTYKKKKKIFNKEIEKIKTATICAQRNFPSHIWLLMYMTTQIIRNNYLQKFRSYQCINYKNHQFEIYNLYALFKLLHTSATTVC